MRLEFDFFLRVYTLAGVKPHVYAALPLGGGQSRQKLLQHIFTSLRITEDTTPLHKRYAKPFRNIGVLQKEFATTRHSAQLASVRRTTALVACGGTGARTVTSQRHSKHLHKPKKHTALSASRNHHQFPDPAVRSPSVDCQKVHKHTQHVTSDLKTY